MKILSTSLPQGMISETVPKYNYQDTYCTKLSTTQKLTPTYVAERIFESPKWVNFLLQVRDFIVKPLGLKTEEMVTANQPNPRLPFPTIAENEMELFMGEKDKHLDFWFSVFVFRLSDNKYEIKLSTVVRFNNWLGRFYFAIIKAFHKYIIKESLKKFANKESKTL